VNDRDCPNYFMGYRAAAIGSMNVFFGIGHFPGRSSA